MLYHLLTFLKLTQSSLFHRWWERKEDFQYCWSTGIRCRHEGSAEGERAELLVFPTVPIKLTAPWLRCQKTCFWMIVLICRTFYGILICFNGPYNWEFLAAFSYWMMTCLERPLQTYLYWSNPSNLAYELDSKTLLFLTERT